MGWWVGWAIRDSSGLQWLSPLQLPGCISIHGQLLHILYKKTHKDKDKKTHTKTHTQGQRQRLHIYPGPAVTHSHHFSRLCIFMSPTALVLQIWTQTETEMSFAHWPLCWHRHTALAHWHWHWHRAKMAQGINVTQHCIFFGIICQHLDCIFWHHGDSPLERRVSIVLVVFYHYHIWVKFSILVSKFRFP